MDAKRVGEYIKALCILGTDSAAPRAFPTAGSTMFDDNDAPDFDPRSNPKLYPLAKTAADIKHASTLYAKYAVGAMRPCKLEDLSDQLVKISSEAREQSSEKAMAIHGLRASLGSASSCLHLGLCKLFGLGTPLVHHHALRLFATTIKLARQSTPPACNTASTASALILASLYMTPRSATALGGLSPEVVQTALGYASDSVEDLQGEAIPDFVYTFCDFWEPRIKSWPQYRKHPEKWGDPVLWKLVHERRKEIKVQTDRLKKKLTEKPNRYQCAALGCSITAESGKALKQCAGKCPEDSKAHYCSVECQKKDWRRHKPFCRPNTPSTPPKATPARVNTDYDFELIFKGLPNSDADIIRTVTGTSGKQYRVKGPKEGIMSVQMIDDTNTKIGKGTPLI